MVVATQVEVPESQVSACPLVADPALTSGMLSNLAPAAKVVEITQGVASDPSPVRDMLKLVVSWTVRFEDPEEMTNGSCSVPVPVMSIPGPASILQAQVSPQQRAMSLLLQFQ
jgi:hypothetical protein